MEKIDNAFGDGPNKTIQTLAADFNVPINHFVEVNFESFQSIVNTIGSVPVYFPYPARDQKERPRHPAGGLQPAERLPGPRLRSVKDPRVLQQRGAQVHPR